MCNTGLRDLSYIMHSKVIVNANRLSVWTKRENGKVNHHLYASKAVFMCTICTRVQICSREQIYTRVQICTRLGRVHMTINFVHTYQNLNRNLRQYTNVLRRNSLCLIVLSDCNSLLLGVCMCCEGTFSIYLWRG